LDYLGIFYSIILRSIAMRRFMPFSLALFFLIALPAYAGAPIATTVAASNISATSVTLNGTVNTNGPWDATVSFDYGLTGGYGTNAPATTGALVNVFDNDKAVAATITGLTCATTYHFRVSATSNMGTTNGGDLTFATSVCPVNGGCGSDQGNTLTGVPTNLCSVGAASAVTSGNSSFTWACSGVNSGNLSNCSANRNYVVTSSVSGGHGTVSASQNVAYNATPIFRLTPAARYMAGPVSGTCGGTLASNNYTTLPVTAACTVVASFVPDTARNALIVNASTNSRQTSVLRLTNPFDQSGPLTATTYSETGTVVGSPNASLGTLSAQQTLALTSAQLEAAIGYAPSSPTANYRVVFNSTLPGLELVNFVRDIATGDLTLGQPQIDNRIFADVSTSTRSALFVNASTSSNKTSVLRIINTGDHIGAITAMAYNENGEQAGRGSAPIATLGAQQMLTMTSAQLESAIGYAPASPTAKYRIALTANLPSFELINFVRDNATGNLTLGQTQIDNRPASMATPLTRNALFVNSSTSTNKTSVLRIINVSESGAPLTATAYNEAGTIVGAANASLGLLAAQQMLTLTSVQLESAIGYIPTSSTAKYRIAFTTNQPSFEIVNFVKDNATGNLTLGQAQIDDRTASMAISSTRNALLVNPSSSTSKTSVLRVINPTAQSGVLTATAYDEMGNTVGTVSAPLGTIAAQQMLTFTSDQLESAILYTPTSSAAKYRIAFTANLPSFEVINFVKDVATGNLTLGQAQID
jgi:hypothetical protein